MALMPKADFGIPNLTPLRGPSADVGTVFELGFLTGRRKPASAYTNADEDLLDRMKSSLAARFDATAGVRRDPTGMAIENFGNADNLMLDATLFE
jgi:nucleoside 2-deoxyribosyltransferase